MATVPMGNDIPSNSHRSKAAAAPAGSEKPPVPTFEGQTAGVKRKGSSSGFLRWCKKMFLSDRSPKDIVKEVVEYRIVPGIKDNFRNSLVSTVDMFIYPGSSPSGPATSQNNVNYNRIFSSGSTTPAAPAVSSQQSKNDEINKGFSNPCFKTQADASRFLEMMKAYDYPTLSVHTMYMMQRKHIDYTWDAYGWTREEIAALGLGAIRHLNNPDWPWMINLPEAHVVA